MCGIIGYIGKKRVSVKDMLSHAKFNIHRGDDGIGIIYFKDSKWHIEKLLDSIDELTTQILNKDKVKKTIRIGALEFTTQDDKKYNKMQKKFSNSIEPILNVESSFIFLHHRKATYGSKEIRNLHPIEYNGKFYIHNGTAYGIDSVRKWMELNLNLKYSSETDTEILAILYNKLMEKFGNNFKRTLDILIEMFPSGWGVLLEIDKSKNITLIKHGERDLWMYEKKGDGVFIISEPTPLMGEYDNLIYLEDGISQLTNHTKGIDYTQNIKAAIKWWDESSNSEDSSFKECDTCKTKKNTVSTFHCLNHPDTNLRNAICFECLLLCKSKNDDEATELEVLRELYSDVIGDLE